ncbi:dihydrofolate reductase family protein [Nocardioides sp.]|jgi:dihydrofolate reductase|uniref:dihydrofolate reductase family protein n=1 Tax=Nocardioides sp. TaxID=35761 RepID=UPI0031FF42AA|nr:riboflavin biosynthesis protein RibD [Nocardioides sp.]
MGRLIVIQFITLDGVVEDPDGSDHSTFGGWAMRHGPQGVAGDKFRLGPILEHGTLLFGRRTWEHFSTLWPHREDPFSQAMNAADKAVVTHREIDPATWSNSRATDRPLLDWVRHHVATTDLVVIGSQSVVDELTEANLIDEYRLLTFPTAVGSGRRLFTQGRELELVRTEHVGPAVLSVLSTRGA